MTKANVIKLLRENGVKANYKNLAMADCSTLNRPYIVSGYCKKDGEIVAYYIYADNKVVFKSSSN